MIYLYKPFIRLLFVSQSDSLPSVDVSSIIEVAKITVPAFLAWSAAYLSNRKERREWEGRQQDKLTAGWSEMTTQSREIITRLQNENIEARTRAQVAEERADKAEKEVESLQEDIEGLKSSFNDLKREYALAVRELEVMKPARSRKKLPE